MFKRVIWKTGTKCKSFLVFVLTCHKYQTVGATKLQITWVSSVETAPFISEQLKTSTKYDFRNNILFFFPVIFHTIFWRTRQSWMYTRLVEKFQDVLLLSFHQILILYCSGGSSFSHWTLIFLCFLISNPNHSLKHKSLTLEKPDMATPSRNF